MCQIEQSVEKQFEIQMNNLPVEVQERILWCLRNDSVTLHRVERVCSLWADIVQFFEKYKSVRWRTIKVMKIIIFLKLTSKFEFGRRILDIFLEQRMAQLIFFSIV